MFPPWSLPAPARPGPPRRFLALPFPATPRSWEKKLPRPSLIRTTLLCGNKPSVNYAKKTCWPIIPRSWSCVVCKRALHMSSQMKICPYHMIVFEVDFINQYSMIEKHYCDYIWQWWVVSRRTVAALSQLMAALICSRWWFFTTITTSEGLSRALWRKHWIHHTQNAEEQGHLHNCYTIRYTVCTTHLLLLSRVSQIRNWQLILGLNCNYNLPFLKKTE